MNGCRARHGRHVAALLLCAGLAACAVGPDFERPNAPTSTSYLPVTLPSQTASADVPGGQAQQFDLDREIPRRWWELFHSPELNALIELALKNNPNVQAAQAALRVAQENVRAQQGAYFPSAVANVSPSRQKVALGTVTSPVTSGDSIFTLHTAQVSVSYVPDVFGANRRQVESLQAQSDLQRYQLEASYLSLTSNLAVGAIQVASLRAQIAATDDLVAIQQQQLAISRRQLDAGAIAEAGVIAQEANLAQVRALLPPLRKQLAIQRDQLAALCGQLPAEAPLVDFDLSALALPEDLPLSLPSRLIEHRPDIRAAEEQLHSASAQVGVATANQLPQFQLTAGAGSTASQIGQLFKSGNVFWSLAGSVTQPLFDGGTLLHRRRAAEAGYDEAAAQYRSAVVSAFQNVGDSLQALDLDAAALQEAALAERAASSSLAIGRRQLELGDISFASLLSVNQTYQQAVIALIQARANRYTDTVALFQSLGGGWWQPPIAPVPGDPDPASP